MRGQGRWALVVALVVLTGCATTAGPRFDATGVRQIDPERAVAGADVFRGDAVLWGGRIARMSVQDDGTELEILRYPLADYQRPDLAAEAGRRFIARHPDQLDPERYRRQRLITLRGNLDGVTEGSVGDYPYTYPVLRITDHELWPEPVSRNRQRERPRFRIGIGVGIGIGL